MRKKLGFKLELHIIGQNRLNQDPAWTSGDVRPTNELWFGMQLFSAKSSDRQLRPLRFHMEGENTPWPDRFTKGYLDEITTPPGLRTLNVSSTASAGTRHWSWPCAIHFFQHGLGRLSAVDSPVKQRIFLIYRLLVKEDELPESPHCRLAITKNNIKCA